jgi:hypothetical protein
MRFSRVFRPACAIVAACLLGGCASRQASHGAMGIMSDEPTAPTPLSLGAGDALGRAVYVNDLILAAAALDKSTTYTNVDQGSSELLVDQ